MVDDSRITKPTAGAQRAFGLAQLVNKVFVTERIPSILAAHAGYRVEMTGPDTMSTSARKGAVHQLSLVPADAAEGKPGDSGAAVIVFGTADPNLSQLELRTYADLQKHHGERFHGETLPIESAAYDVIRKKVEAFFDCQGITTISSATRYEATVRPSSVPPPRSRAWIVVVALCLFVAVVAAFFALKK